ncbi:MAG: tetratricopeptide repeat protein [Bacteroidota bacterium]
MLGASITAELYAYRGAIFYNMQKYDKAIQDFDNALILNPNLPEVYYNRGLLYHLFEPKQLEKALSNYDIAIEFNPYLVDAYNNRGIIYFALKQYDNAIQDYIKAIQLDKENIGYKLNLVELYITLTNMMKQLAALKHILINMLQKKVIC